MKVFIKLNCQGSVEVRPQVQAQDCGAKTKHRPGVRQDIYVAQLILEFNSLYRLSNWAKVVSVDFYWLIILIKFFLALWGSTLQDQSHFNVLLSLHILAERRDFLELDKVILEIGENREHDAHHSERADKAEHFGKECSKYKPSKLSELFGKLDPCHHLMLLVFILCGCLS